MACTPGGDLGVRLFGVFQGQLSKQCTLITSRPFRHRGSPPAILSSFRAMHLRLPSSSSSSCINLYIKCKIYTLVLENMLASKMKLRYKILRYVVGLVLLRLDLAFKIFKYIHSSIYNISFNLQNFFQQQKIFFQC